MKPNCYDCKWRDEVPGDCHSCCKHPSLKADPVGNLMAIFASVGRVAPVSANSSALNVRGNPHGIRKGWFNFPWNFDPVWLENCDGFETKTETRQATK